MTAWSMQEGASYVKLMRRKNRERGKPERRVKVKEIKKQRGKRVHSSTKVTEVWFCM